MKNTFSILLLIIALSVAAQDEFTFNALGSKHYSDFEEFENQINSRFKVATSFNPHFSEYYEDLYLNVTSQAHIFLRADNSFTPELAVWYFMNEDSIVNGIYYKWGFYNPDFNPSENVELLKAQEKRLKDYRQQFEKIKSNLIMLLGNNFEEVLKSNSKSNFYEYCMWDLEESRTVLEIVFNPTLTEIQGFVAGGDSHITINTFRK